MCTDGDSDYSGKYRTDFVGLFLWHHPGRGGRMPVEVMRSLERALHHHFISVEICMVDWG